MTQLTFHTRSAFVARQRQQQQNRQGNRDSRSPSPVPAWEGDAHARMARVRRNSQTGRRRHISEQPEQRNVRPRDGATENGESTMPQTHLPARPQVLPYTPYPATNSVSYRGIPPPARLVTSDWNLVPGNFIDSRSPASLASPENSTLGFSAYDTSSFTSDRNRTLSPLEYTPTHSVASVDRTQSQDSLSAFLSSRTYSDSGSTSFFDRTLHHGLFTLLKSWLCIQ